MSDALVEIQEPAIISTRAAGMFHVEQQISHGEVCAVRILAAQYVFGTEIAGFDVLAVEEELTDFVEMRLRLRIVMAVTWGAGPNSRFVQRQPFALDATEDHRAKPPVTDG